MNREKDRCLLCRRETPYYKDQPIEERDYTFVAGAGQLCKECYDYCEALRYYTSR